MATVKRITIINNMIVVEETMTIVGRIALCSLHINGELVAYEILAIRQLWDTFKTVSQLGCCK